MSARVVVDGVRFAYPDGRKALRGASLVVEAGERVAVLGPNGAGKTTLALHINGIYEPQAGSVTIGDTPVTPETLVEVRRRVGLVFQDSNDQLFMSSVYEDVAFGPANLGVTGDQLEARVVKALAGVGASELSARPPHHLSGGEKRRAALATVLSMEPDVLVIDEPSSGLDPAGRRDIIATLLPLKMTQLIITHDLALALELCPRSVIMNEGVVLADGPTRDLLADDTLLSENRLELPYGLVLKRGNGSRS